MSKKGNSTVDPCRTSGSRQEIQEGHLDKSNFKTSEQSAYDSRHSDSGVWSGSNIQSEEIHVQDLDSPVSKSDSFSYSSEKVASDNKTYMRLDSGIDVGLSVSQHFSELSLKDVDAYNDLGSRGPTSSTQNINEQISRNPKTSPGDAAFFNNCFQKNEDGDTQLHLAIINKFIEPVYALVRMVPYPAYLDIMNDDRQTPLHLAVLTRQSRLVRLLVSAGASLEAQDYDGNTALHLAVQAEDLACVRAIIDPVTIAEVVQTKLQYSPPQFQSKKVISDIANIVNYEGQACVHLAALNGNIEIFRHLVWAGANVNAKEWKGGETCLHMAVSRRDLQLCTYLLSLEDIDVEDTTYAGYTAYQTACRGAWDNRIATALRQHGVDTYDDSDTDEDDMMDLPENSFANGFATGGGMVGVGA